METPDKIYLPKEEIEGRMPWIATPYEDDPNWDECYIRKEAMMEWLESKVYEYNEDRFDDGFNAALGQVIDKLNEM